MGKYHILCLEIVSSQPNKTTREYHYQHKSQYN